MKQQTIVAHERRIIRRLEGRGEAGLGEALVRLDGSIVGRRFRIESLYAVGSEGAVYLARDIEDPSAPMRVAKVALLPLHRPFDLTDEELQRRRESLREEATNLARSDTRYMPASCGLFHFQNPALEADWGGEFAEPEPCLIMEKIPGFDLDLWLARMHSSRVPKVLLRRQLDHVAVVVLSALMELQDHGFFYTDLRPGNVRIRGRSKERVRLLDAGSLVRVDDLSGKFPHVPAYLPPELFDSSHGGGVLLPTPAVQAVMAGRTLFEVATGRVPLPGEPVETAALYGLTVSPSVAETVERLCRGSFPDVATALAYLSENFRHDASERAAQPAAAARSVTPSAARPSGAAPAREAPRSAVPEPLVPEPPPVTFSLPPAKPRLDLHSMLASARSAPPAVRSPARSAERPASLVAVRPAEPRNEPAPAAAARAVTPTAVPRVVAPPAVPQVAATAPAPPVARPAASASPATSVRPVPPPVRPAKQAPAVKRVDDPLDFEFAEKYGAALARGEAPPPVAPAKRPAPVVPDVLPTPTPSGGQVTHISVLEPITSEAVDDRVVRPAAVVPSPPQPAAPKPRPPAAKPPLSTAVPLAQSFTLSPATPRPQRSARETQTEFNEPPPRASDVAPARAAPARAASPAAPSQVASDRPVAAPATPDMGATGDMDESDGDPILPPSPPRKSFLARLIDRVFGRR